MSDRVALSDERLAQRRAKYLTGLVWHVALSAISRANGTSRVIEWCHPLRCGLEMT